MIYRSRDADVVVPDVTLTRHVLGPATALGPKIALIDITGTETITYADLDARVRAVAGGLAALGVGPGAVVALISHNQPRYAVAMHGVIAAGAALTPINPVLTAGEITKILAASRASVVIASPEGAEVAAQAADATCVALRFVLDAPGGDVPPGFAPFSDLECSGAPAPELDLDPATTVAALPFSSGTTGLPKGVRLTHRNLVANLEQNRVGWPVTGTDVLPAALPFFHIYGFTMILNAGLRGGATVVTMPRFELRAYLAAVERHRITRAFLAPPMVLTLANAPETEEFDLSSLDVAMCGAAPLDVAVAEQAEKRLGCLIRQGYGMTEASPGTHLVPIAEAATTPAGSVGRLLASTEARLIDPATLDDVPPGETGELWIRGPQVMAGYLDDPDATAATLVDGWLRTGDLVRIDENDVYWVVDRIKELIKYKGYQVAPAELEAVLLTHPAVLDAAVVGVPHREGGEAPKAVVVTSGPLDATELMAWVAERVAPYKKVRSVEFVDVIPKSATGKILRRLLR